MSYAASTVPATTKTPQPNTWPFPKCSRLMHDEHSLALMSLTWRQISQWNSVVWRRSCRRQTCLSRKQRPCQWLYTFSLLQWQVLGNFSQPYLILQSGSTWLRLGSFRNIVACFDLPGGNDGFWVYVYRFTSRIEHDALPYLDPTGSRQPSRVQTINY